MNQFNNLSEALTYHKCCPVCQSGLKINDKDLLLEYSSQNNSRLSFELSENSCDVLFIDPRTEDIEIVTYDSKDYSKTIYIGTQSSRVGTNNFLLYKGILITKLTIDCDSCYQFCYVLQLHVNLTDEVFLGAYLNSEWICVEELDTTIVHEIRNVYSTNKTMYTYFSKDGCRDKNFSIPLIELNINEPMETVNRIKKLIIFS